MYPRQFSFRRLAACSRLSVYFKSTFVSFSPIPCLVLSCSLESACFFQARRDASSPFQRRLSVIFKSTRATSSLLPPHLFRDWSRPCAGSLAVWTLVKFAPRPPSAFSNSLTFFLPTLAIYNDGLTFGHLSLSHYESGQKLLESHPRLSLMVSSSACGIIIPSLLCNHAIARACQPLLCHSFLFRGPSSVALASNIRNQIITAP
jgi:hypothetical protein